MYYRWSASSVAVTRCAQHVALRSVVVLTHSSGVARHLGELVQELREDAGHGVRDLGKASGVDSGIISRLERRQQASVSPENLSRLAQALGTTADELLRRTKDDTGQPARREWPTLEEWLRRDRNLTERQRQAILAVYEGYVRPR